jgi:GxxExxY protein
MSHDFVRHGDPAFVDRALNSRILDCAVNVHRRLGPGLLESSYRTCLVHELQKRGLSPRSEVPIELSYDEIRLECGYRADIIVNDLILLELKAVERLLPIHSAQLLTYLKWSRLRVGFLLNFNVAALRDGMKRFLR